MAPMDPPWKAAATVWGLRMAPSNIATYAAEAASHACASALTGSEKNTLHALRTAGSLNAMISPPSTMAARMARKVTTAGLPSTTADTIVWFSVAVRLVRGPPAAGSGVPAGAGDPGCSALTAARPLPLSPAGPRPLDPAYPWLPDRVRPRSLDRRPPVPRRHVRRRPSAFRARRRRPSAGG